MNKTLLVALILCIVIITSICLVGCKKGTGITNEKAEKAYNASYNRALINMGGEWQDVAIETYNYGENYFKVVTSDGYKFYASKENIILYYSPDGKAINKGV